MMSMAYNNASLVQILHVHGDHQITISDLHCDSGKFYCVQHILLSSLGIDVIIYAIAVAAAAAAAT